MPRPEVTQGSSGPDDCEVYQFTRPLRNLQSSSNGSCNQSSGSGVAVIDHWYVVFKYGKDVLLAEANDLNGTLTGTWKQMKIDDFDKEYPGEKKYLGKFKIPMQYVKDKVNELKNCGPYKLIGNNCQTWLRTLLKALRVPDFAFIDVNTAVCTSLGVLSFGVMTHCVVGDLERTWNQRPRLFARERRVQAMPYPPVAWRLNQAGALRRPFHF